MPVEGDGHRKYLRRDVLTPHSRKRKYVDYGLELYPTFRGPIPHYEICVCYDVCFDLSLKVDSEISSSTSLTSGHNF